jgi:hypothetical protein
MTVHDISICFKGLTYFKIRELNEAQTIDVSWGSWRAQIADVSVQIRRRAKKAAFFGFIHNYIAPGQ